MKQTTMQSTGWRAATEWNTSLRLWSNIRHDSTLAASFVTQRRKRVSRFRHGSPGEFVISGCLAPPPLQCIWKKSQRIFTFRMDPTGQLRGMDPWTPPASYAAVVTVSVFYCFYSRPYTCVCVCVHCAYVSFCCVSASWRINVGLLIS